MAVSANLYGRAEENFIGGSGAAEARQWDYLSDTVKCMLTTATYAPALDTHEVKADVTNEITGTGYTAGGTTLASKTITYTAANSWGTAWAATTAYAAGDVVRPVTGNGHLFRCTVAGTSGGTEPTWVTTSGRETADGATVKWAEIGRGITVIDSADPSWSSATFTARYGVIYNDTPTDKPLMALIDFGADTSVTSGTFTIVLSALGIFNHATP